MSVRDTSLDLPILESAKTEFRKMGFEKSSLKEIAEKAGVTTGAIYKRYNGKEDLFCAVVESCINRMQEVFEQKKRVDYSLYSDQQLKQCWEMDFDYMMWWFNILFEYKDEFVLLLTCSAGTKYENFGHDWVEQMTNETWRCYEEMFSRKLTTVVISKKELHTMLTSFWTTIYEPFIHEFSKGEIKKFSELVCRMFNWEKVFEIK